MSQLLDEDLAKMLDRAPDPDDAVTELFDRASSTSEQRFFLAVTGLERHILSGKLRPVFNSVNHWVVAQFARYLESVAVKPDNLDAQEEEFVVYLQMLAYSLFWECLGIQRLIWSLVRTCESQPYDPRLLLDSDPGTHNLVHQHLVPACTRSNLKLAELIAALYHSQVRNSFAHSDVLVFNRAISCAPRISPEEKNYFHMTFATWDRLFALVLQFAKALFRARRDAEQQLRDRAPYDVDLPELQPPFPVYLDPRGGWRLSAPPLPSAAPCG